MELMSTLHGVANVIFLSLVVGIPLYGVCKRVDLLTEFVSGAKHGLETLWRILPYLLALFIAIGMFRASGAIDTLSAWLSPLLQRIGFPAELLPLALVRPLSGSAANAVSAELMQTHGGDALISQMAATLMGSTETTFYVIAIYFGAVAIRRTRHAVIVGLAADCAGIFAAVWICRWLLT